MTPFFPSLQAQLVDFTEILWVLNEIIHVIWIALSLAREKLLVSGSHDNNLRQQIELYENATVREK